MTGVIAQIPKFQFSSAAGAPLVGGSLTVYLANGSTPADTWQDSELTIANTNPVQLDSRGECVLWLDAAKVYKFVLANAGGVLQWTQDNISGQARPCPAPCVNDFEGANALARAQAMIAAMGFARFAGGGYAMTTGTLDGLLVFDAGAYLTLATGNTLSITGAIESPRQYVFQGDGVYELKHDTDSGENARRVHVSWFGVTPNSSAAIDQSPGLQRAFDAVGNVRESVVDIDIGSYRMESGVIVPRACHFRGSGSRRTVLDPASSGWDVLTTGGVGVRMSGFMMELPSDFVGLTRTSGAFIKIAHGECELDDIWGGRATTSIVVAGGNARLRNISATYSEDPGAGATLIKILSNGASVDGVLAGTSEFGPNALVQVGGSDAVGTCGNFNASNLSWVTPCAGVQVMAFGGDVVRGTISDLHYNGLAGTNALDVIKLATKAGTAHSVSGVVISNVVGSGQAVNLVYCAQESTGVMEGISIDGVYCAGISGTGIKLNHVAGAMRDIRIGDSCNVSNAAIPVQISGAPTGLRISSNVMPDEQIPRCYDFNLLDDTAASIKLYKSVFSGLVLVTVGSTNFGLYVARAASTPAVTAINASAAMATALTALTGTTGADLKFTVGITDGVLYFENRLGSTQRVSVSLLSGV